MSTHLYAIGETVSLTYHEGQFLAKLNPFTVEAHMPPVGTSLQYRVKSDAETCRRVVPEHQLTLVAAKSDSDSATVGLPNGAH